MSDKAAVGGLIIASAIALHIFLRNRSISSSRCLHTLLGHDFEYSTARFPILLGYLMAGAAIAMKKKELIPDDNGDGLTIWGYLLAGLFIGLGTSFSGAGIETQMWTFLANFDRWTIAAIGLTFLGAFGGATLAVQKPDVLSFLFGSPDGIPKFDSSDAKISLIVVLVAFILFICFHFFQRNCSMRQIIDMCISFLCGALYALGLAAGGLCDKTKVQAFFDWTGSFKADAGICMLVALVASIVLTQILNRYSNPEKERFPSNDQYLYMGSIIFGLGWGMCGLAIGPIFTVSAALCGPVLFLLLPLMIVGFIIDRR